jgi:hypothetical protein
MTHRYEYSKSRSASHLVDFPIYSSIILNSSLAKYRGLGSISSGWGHTEDRAITVLVATTVPIKGTELLGQLREQQPLKKDSSLRSWFVNETLCLTPILLMWSIG